jgi:phage terminase large subunit GpA-like protein
METGVMPDGAYVITCGIDVQRNRIEIEFVGWGRSEESWSLAYEIIPGDPASNEIWALLDAVVMRSFRHKSGVMLSAYRIFIDSGDGEHMDRIYAWAKSRTHLGVFACKGSSDPKAPICGAKSFQKKAGIDLYLVGTNACKDLIYGRLQTEPGKPGSMHFPVGRQQEWFEQLVAEEGQYKKGLKVYVKIRARNEALDCRVYAIAALRSIGVSVDDIANAFEAPIAEKKQRTITEV